jgi:catechol 2,3-dioxygenase-like lactoylglutathione lyase family enzyme
MEQRQYYGHNISTRKERATTMKVLGLDHMQLAIPAGAEQRARAFYAELLGFAEIPKPPALATRGGCWFQCGALQLHLGCEAEFAPARKAHPAFLVADLDAAQRALNAAGIVTTPDHTVTGVQRFYAADPFGNRLEFIQDGEGFNQERLK